MADMEKKQPEMEEAVRVAEVLKPEQTFPRDKKLVKTMMYEASASFVASLFRSEKRRGKVAPQHQSRR